MATDSPSHGPRRHFHRSRRGHDRRGPDRRGPQQQQGQAAPETGTRGGDNVDVEQITREIRSRIAQQHGIDLTEQQVQDLAARRLESILDPRTIKPSLLEQLRRSAGTPPDTVKAAERREPPFTFGESTLYESPNGFVRFMRKLLNPILKLFFDPKPLINTLQIQSQFNMEAARREAERDQRQAEWNALHYEILRRLVSEVSKVSLEMQSLALRVESLSTKVDFNERRVRGLEGTVQPTRPGGGSRERERDRDRERESATPPAVPLAAAVDAVSAPGEGTGETAPAGPGEVPRRRRRRRRGRRGGREGGVEVAAQPGADAGAEADVEGDEIDDVPEPEAAESTGEVHETLSPPAGPAPERVTPQLEAEAPEAREAAAPDLPPAPASEPLAAPEAGPDRNEPQ